MHVGDKLLLLWRSDPAKARALVGKLLGHFWGAQPPRVLQLRANLIPRDGGVVIGATEFIPQGMYFDIVLNNLPSVFPADLSNGLGKIRWFVKNARTTDYMKSTPPDEQPRSRFQRAMAKYFLKSGHENPAESSQGFPRLTHSAQKMPRVRRGGRSGEQTRAKEDAESSGTGVQPVDYSQSKRVLDAMLLDVVEEVRRALPRLDLT